MTIAHTLFRHFTSIWRITALSSLMVMAACNNGGGGGSGSADLSLFAGNLDSKGNVDGTGSVARFLDVRGGTFDTAGNLYVADTSNHTIRKVTPAGVVTTFAGLSGYAGSANGTGPLARFNTPFAVAADKANPSNIYVADTGNNIIRKITSAGVVTTFAGTGSTIFADDPTGTSATTIATFNSPQGITTDNAGNVYVADTGNQRIRKITTAGAVTTLAGNGSGAFADNAAGTSASFYNPQGIATDSSANIYVGDTSNHRIRFITPAGAVSTLAGSGAPSFADGAGVAASFNNPIGVATDSSGNVYVADTSNQIIRKITSGGAVTTLAGTGSATTPTIGSANGTGASASFYTPIGISVDSSNNVYVADANNRAIRKITPAGVVTTFSGASGIGSLDGSGPSAGFNLTRGAVSDNAGNLYVVDSNNHTIRKITPSGAVSTYAGRPGVSGYSDGSGSNAIFSSPGGIAIDSTGNLYVADTGNQRIRIIPTTGTFAGYVSLFAGSGTATFADGQGALASFNNPRSVATDSSGNVYVVDRDNQRIRKIIADGTVSTLAGSGTATFADGKGTAASFNGPWGIATDSAGNLYVADRNNHIIRKITPTGDVSTIAGKAGIQGSSDGGGVARFNYPQGVATDGLGNVYISDFFNHNIRKITANGIVSTVVGVAGQGGFTPGALPGLIAFPEAITFSGSSLFIAMSNGIAVVKNFR